MAEQISCRSAKRRLLELIARGESDVDASPFVHVADAFMLEWRSVVAPFADG